MRLINAYIQQVKGYTERTENVKLDQVESIFKHYIIELINGITSTNLKVRAIAEKIFIDICTMMREKFNAVNQLFSIILVGLAGNKSHTKSSTIRALIFTIK